MWDAPCYRAVSIVTNLLTIVTHDMIAILQSNVKSFARNHKFPLVPHKGFSSIVIFLQQTSEIIAFFLLFFKVFNKYRFNIVNSLFIKRTAIFCGFFDFLSKKEKEKFDELAKQLVDLKIMTNLDCDVLARYIKAESEYIKVTKQLQKIKFTPDKKSMIPADVQLSEQYTQYNYLSKIQNRLMKACNENAKELGLTISSRCKLVIPKEKEEKPANKFMKHAQ